MFAKRVLVAQASACVVLTWVLFKKQTQRNMCGFNLRSAQIKTTQAEACATLPR
jgi:hypothetical protein